MLNKCKKLLTMLFCGMVVVTLLSMPTFAQEENDSKEEITQENVLTGNQKVFIKGLDAGPAITKTIIKLNDVVKADSVDKNDFVVEEEKMLLSIVIMMKLKLLKLIEQSKIFMFQMKMEIE